MAVWITIFWFFIIFVNIFGTLGYAEEEFVSSLFKLIMTVIFMVVAIVLICGGGPSSGIYDEYWGARLWYDPGAFQNGFRGFCSVFVTAAFAFAGTELVGVSTVPLIRKKLGTDSVRSWQPPSPRTPPRISPVQSSRSSGESLCKLRTGCRMPTGVLTMYSFYILGLTFVGLLVSSTDDRLLNAGNPYADGTSPFVLGPKDAGLVGYDSVMNVVILVSVVSIGVSCVYGGSRTLTALSQQGYAPKCFCYIDKSGRPLLSVSLCLAFGGLAYITLASQGSVVFDWLLALSGLAALFTWGSICVVSFLVSCYSRLLLTESP